MATKRQRWSSEGDSKKTKRSKKVLEVFDIFTPSPCLTRLPDNVTLTIMFYLDALSVIRLSRVCKRFHSLSQDEHLWVNVDMSTLPYMDIKNTKKFVDQKLSERLYAVKIKSGYELRGRAARRPRVDIGVLNALVEKCKNIEEITLSNCDLSFLNNADCKLLSVESLRKVSLVHCNTHIHWLAQATWPHLTELSLIHTVKTGEFEMKAIATKWPNLLSLNLTGCYRINDACIKTLCQSESSSIQRLLLVGTSITDNCFVYLQKLHKLQELDLSNAKGVTGNLLKLPTLLPFLKLLRVSSLSDKLDSTSRSSEQITIVGNTTVLTS